MPIVLSNQCLKIAHYLLNKHPDGVVSKQEVSQAITLFGGTTDHVRQKYITSLNSLGITSNIKSEKNDKMQVHKEAVDKLRGILHGEFYELSKL